ncbi:RelA/SpoT family protein [Flexithrix dorotheae]|uniref:RelA/SpoT family protein n=1 Tax=Flexithrix dorotheae TaxID=70993 RepID=UPI000382F0B2|nr:RelA/SpoT family protein [Flexithrix dorotheae]
MEIDHEKEKQTILRMYRRLLRKAKPFLKDDDAKIIKRAFLFAQDAHKEMRRKSGEPYIYHPIEVAEIAVEEIGLGTTSIVAALLHDVVEDTAYDIQDIQERFGGRVAKIVDGLTKISTKATKGKSIQAENFQRLLLTISEDTRVVLIKIADRLHNMRTLDSMPDHKKLKIKSETEYIYAPLAHRLGLYTIKSELEDLCLKFSDKDAYFSILRGIEDSRAARTRFSKRFIRPLELAMKRDGYKFQIKTRIKSVYSIYKKMRKQNIPFEQVFDLFAIRIIVEADEAEEKAVCWKVYSIVTDYYTPNVNRLRDWISMPKSNGYESLHTTVMSNSGQWVEVQIRTKRMDDIAEKGYAAHWKYKHGPNGKVVKGEQGIDLWLQEIRDMLETTKSHGVEFVNDFKSNLFVKEVFVFTPKGEMKIYPKGATILDFAFDIHSEIGAKCLAAKANGKLVAFNYEIQNGDQIEILTSNKQKVNEDWLKVVRTSKAKSKIKDYLKDEKKTFAREGKEIVKRKFKQLKISYDEQNIRKLAQYFSLKSESDLFYMVGKGLIDHTEIKKFINHVPEEKNQKSRENGKEKQDDEAVIQKLVKEKELVIGEMTDLSYSMASCCSPIPGDEIFGFITINKGIKIHRKTCPNAISLMANYGYRIIRARWASERKVHDEGFSVSISIEGTDRVGLVNDVTRVISNQMQVNIKSISIGTENDIFKGNIDLSVQNKVEFEKLIVNLEKIDGVVKVTRIEELV